MAIKSKNPWSVFLAVFVFSLMCVSSVWAGEESEEMEDPFEGKPPLADQLQQFSDEIAKRVHQELQELLDKELKIPNGTKNIVKILRAVFVLTTITKILFPYIRILTKNLNLPCLRRTPIMSSTKSANFILVLIHNLK